MVLTDISHVIAAHVELERHSNGAVNNVVVVYTDLELDSQHPNYDKVLVDKLLADLQSHRINNPHHIGTIRVRTKR